MKHQKLAKSEMIKQYIPYVFFLDDEESIVYNKNDTIQKTIKITYRNLDFAGDDEREFVFDQLNEAIISLSTEDYFTIYFETQRKQIEYEKIPVKVLEIPVQKIFEERYEQIKKEKNSYTTENYITINFKINRVYKNLFQKFLNKKEVSIEESINTDFNEYIEEFESKINEFISLIKPVILDYKFLKGNELQAFLYSQITSDFLKKIEINYDNTLDEFFSFNDFENKGKYSKINNEYISCLSFINFPELISARILKDLESLKFNYRYSIRFQNEKNNKLIRTFKNIRSFYEVATKSAGEYAMRSYSRYEDETSREDANETHKAIGELNKKEASFGYLSSTIIVKDKNFKNLQKKIKEISEIIRTYGFHCKNDIYNMFGSYFGAMAGNNNYNKRKGLTASTSVLSMIPISSSYKGYDYNKFLKEPALFNAFTSNNDYYSFNLHVDDVGHTMIAGETGGGKSTLLLLIILCILRIEEARVILFDKGQSSKAFCKCMGGKFINIGKDDFSFQIMEKINQPSYREFIEEWLLSIAELENFDITIVEKNKINEILEILSEREHEERTFTNFYNLLSNNRLKMLFEKYVFGSYKKYFNGMNVKETNRFIVYDLDSISDNDRLQDLILSYMFFDMEKTMLNGKLLGVFIDEAWKSLQSKLIKSHMNKWLREYRKKKALFGFATQGVSEIVESDIIDVIITNCRTKIFLANEGAETLRELYHKLGITDEEIKIIKKAKPKQEYFIKNRLGSTLIDFKLGKMAIKYLGSTSIENQQKIDRICSKTNDIEEINKIFLEN